jgi:hypothetical protein
MQHSPGRAVVEAGTLLEENAMTKDQKRKEMQKYRALLVCGAGYTLPDTEWREGLQTPHAKMLDRIMARDAARNFERRRAGKM